MREWQEIEVEFFRDIWRRFYMHQEYTAGKVIEFQVIPPLFDSGGFVRLFIGAGLDLPEFMAEKFVVSESKDGVPEPGKRDHGLTTCTCLGEACSFNVIGYPTRTASLIENMNWFYYFGDKKNEENEDLCRMAKKAGVLVPIETPVWYCKTPEGKIKLPQDNNSYPGEKKYIRLRVHEYSEWKKIMEFYLKKHVFPGELLKDDITRDKIE